MNSSSENQNDVSVLAGRIRFYINNWKYITKDKFILDVVKGFSVPFFKKPVQLNEPKENIFHGTELSLIDVEIRKLIKCKAIVQTCFETDQFVSTIFSVPKHNGKIRLVINLKTLNNFVECPHFKMEDYRTACSLIQLNNYMAVLDQRDAYHAIPLKTDHQKYFKFRYKGILYKYTCLPFGLNVAPYIFTKLMKPVFGTLREQGHISVTFLDDSLLIGENKEVCEQNVQVTRKMFESLGLLVHNEKSILQPTKIVKFLGFIFDSSNLSLSLPTCKKEKVDKMCKSLLNQAKVSLQILAEFLGTLVSVLPCMPYGSLYVKQLEFEKVQGLKQSYNNYQPQIILSNESCDDIKWWQNHIQHASANFYKSNFHVVMYTDSSLTGWGGIYNDRQTKGTWDASKQVLHINELELMAVLLTLQSLCNDENIHILLRCDNTTAVAYINNHGGCRGTRSHQIAKDIWQFCERRKINIFASYIHTSVNFRADALSREVRDMSDFMLDKEVFKYLCNTFFCPTVDIFASNHTNQCDIFYSWFPCPGSSVCDAFTIKWDDKFYAFPPFCLLSKVLQKIIVDKVTGILVAPYWPSQPWFPLYKKLCVSEMLVLCNPNLLLCPFTNRIHSLSSQIKLVAAVLSSNISKRKN